MAPLKGTFFMLFFAENDRHWTEEHLLCQSFCTSFGVKIPTNKKELGYKHLNSAEFINSFLLFWILKQTAEAYASGTSQAII